MMTTKYRYFFKVIRNDLDGSYKILNTSCVSFWCKVATNGVKLFDVFIPVLCCFLYVLHQLFNTGIRAVFFSACSPRSPSEAIVTATISYLAEIRRASEFLAFRSEIFAKSWSRL